MDFKKEKLMMSEEEVRKRAKELLNESQADLITKYMFLEQQCKKQKEVIDKAKKLIEHFKLTEWGMNGYESLDLIQNILNENEVSE